MVYQPVKFYQTGTFTVGNRLLPPEERAVQANMRRTNSLNSGHRACQGCGEALGARYAVDAAMQAASGKLIRRLCALHGLRSAAEPVGGPAARALQALC